MYIIVGNQNQFAMTVRYLLLLDNAQMSLHHAVEHGKPKAGALALLLDGKDGSEYLFQVLGRSTAQPLSATRRQCTLPTILVRAESRQS